MKHFKQNHFFKILSLIILIALSFLLPVSSFAADDSITLSVTSGADITSDLQNAIKSGYKSITIPAGTYTCRRINLDAANGYTINAKDAILSVPAGHAGAMLAIAATSSAHDIIINGGTWINSSANTTVQIYGNSVNIQLKDLTIKDCGKDAVRIQNGTNITLFNCTITNASNFGVVLKDCKNCSLNSCNINTAKNTAVRLDNSTDILMNQTSICQNGAYGIYCDSSTATLTDCSCNENYWNGISITKEASKLTVTGGSFCSNGKRPDKYANDDSLASGIGVYAGAQLTITNANCSKNHACGIAANGSTIPSSAKIYGCTLTENEDHGFGGRPNCKLIMDKAPNGERNIIKNNKHNGLLVCDRSIAEKIKNCDIDSNGEYGISVSNNAKATLISNCTVTLNKKGGIHFTEKSSAKKIEKCKVSQNKDSGISFFKKSSASIIQSCTSSSNTACGLYVTEASSASAKGCTFESNRRDGASASGKNTKITLKSCTAKKNKKNGYRISNKAKLVSMQKCKANDNKVAGLELSKKATLGTYKSNTYSNNKQFAVIVSGCKVAIQTQY